MVTEDRQSFFKGNLEPIAHGDAVARPIVEILMADHRFDTVVISVGGHIGRCHHVAGVKDIQALVFHGTEVKVIGSHDAETV